jgi:hypothetical protein
MTNTRERLVHLVIVRDLSSVQMMSTELGIPEEEVGILLTELTQEGTLRGHLTEDGARYFKYDVKVSEAPAIDRREHVPEFMKFDERPGQVAAIIGLVITAIGTYGLMTAGGNIDMESFGAIVMLIGVAVVLAGCYYLSMRKTPS